MSPRNWAREIEFFDIFENSTRWILLKKARMYSKRSILNEFTEKLHYVDMANVCSKEFDEGNIM